MGFSLCICYYAIFFFSLAMTAEPKMLGSDMIARPNHQTLGLTAMQDPIMPAKPKSLRSSLAR